jgi:transposase
MERIAYVGLDLHKKTVAWCAKDERGRIVGEGTVGATRGELAAWAAGLGRPWIGAMEATLFTGWIYDWLKPHARQLKVAHPLMLKAIAAGKKKNDKVDARMLADLLRCDLLPECHMAPPQVRELRRVLRYRRLAVEQMVKMKNKTAGLLMEVGAEYDKRRLHGKGYFAALLERLTGELPESVADLLRLSRQAMLMYRDTGRRLVATLREHPALARRVEMLMTIPAVGEVTALTWALEIDDPHRFGSIARAISYCGLCSAQRESAGQDHRGPLSKQRNRHLQTVLVEAAKLAPRFSPAMAALHARELARGGRNRATLAVARKLVAWLLAIDKSAHPFEQRDAGAGRKNEFSSRMMNETKKPKAANRRASGPSSHGADVALQQSAANKILHRPAAAGKLKQAVCRRSLS